MSYEPTIYVRKKDLENFRDQIENAEWDTVANTVFRGRNAKEDRQNLIDAYDQLKNALDGSTIKFPEVEIIPIWVEFTSKNGRVRELLTELGIEYKLED